MILHQQRPLFIAADRKKAHKGIKATLPNCVMSAMRYNAYFKAYHERKLKEGKNKFTVFNAMKNNLGGRPLS
jgi:transposase